METFQVLCNCEIVTEGFDAPDVHVICVVRPTQSLALHRQMAGRALRPAPGKTHCLLLDHAGNVRRHGSPTRLVTWSLQGVDEPPPPQEAPAEAEQRTKRTIPEEVRPL